MQFKTYGKWMATATLLLSLTACSATYQNHGYFPDQDEIDSLVVGVDTRASVEESVGSPSAGGVLRDSGYFYVRSRVRTFGPFRPKEIEREVLAISFDQDGVISNIERFALEDGVVVALERRVTSAAVDDKTFLRQLLGNIGRVGGIVP